MEKQTLPNATISLVLGILSILTCCCYGVIGLPLGIVAFVLGNKAIKLNNDNLGEFTGVSNAKTGKILGIIGIVLNIITVAYIIWIISYIGWDVITDPQLMQERIQELQGV